MRPRSSHSQWPDPDVHITGALGRMVKTNINGGHGGAGGDFCSQFWTRFERKTWTRQDPLRRQTPDKLCPGSIYAQQVEMREKPMEDVEELARALGVNPRQPSKEQHGPDKAAFADKTATTLTPD